VHLAFGASTKLQGSNGCSLTSYPGHHDIDKLIIQSNQNAAINDWLIELVHCRDGTLHLSGNDFDMHDILSMINLLSTS
jgi:hypothetical protein